MATAPTYCTHRQLKDVFPQVDSFDNKRALYGWKSGLTDWYDTSLDIFYSANVGLITKLFVDGVKIDKITYNTTETTKLDGALTASAAVFYVDASHGLEANDIVKIDNEYIRVTSVDSDTISCASAGTNRGLFGSSAQHHANDASVYLIIDASTDVGDSSSADPNALSFVYDTHLDLCLLIGNDLTTNDPNNNLVEGGEDFSTLITRITANASRYLDSRLDPNLPQNQLKDKEGNYDYIIIRTTALITAGFMIRSHDAISEIADKMMAEVDNNIELLNTGKAGLSWQTTGDSSKGVIRDVTYTDGSVRPVDTRGRWSGSWDLIKVSISASTAGAIGTAKFNVYVKDSDGLKNNQVVTEEVITGDYQTLASGLQIRFGGSTDSSVATASNEWEIEVVGYNEEIDLNNTGSKKMTRGGAGIYGNKGY